MLNCDLMLYHGQVTVSLSMYNYTLLKLSLRPLINLYYCFCTDEKHAGVPEGRSIFYSFGKQILFQHRKKYG